MKLKEKYQVTTLAGKEDDTNSTAIVTTATFTSCCESEWDEYNCYAMIEPRTLNDHTYGFGRRRWVKPVRKWRTPVLTPSLQEETTLIQT